MDGIVIVIQTYINLVKSGKITIDDIPDRYKEKVKEQLERSTV